MATKSGIKGTPSNLRTDKPAIEILRDYFPSAVENVWYTDGSDCYIMVRGNFWFTVLRYNDWFWTVGDTTRNESYHYRDFSDGQYPTLESVQKAVVEFYERELAD